MDDSMRKVLYEDLLTGGSKMMVVITMMDGEERDDIMQRQMAIMSQCMAFLDVEMKGSFDDLMSDARDLLPTLDKNKAEFGI